MASTSAAQQVDNAIASFFSTGNEYTLVLAGFLVILLLWPILTSKDPDIHPFLLARQAQASPVRQPGESALYRANDIPYGFPLRKGLGVKDPGAPAWTAGRDGDLRDVWRKAVQGATDDKGTPLGKRGQFLTVLGREKVIKQDFDNVTKSINAIGRFVQQKGAKTVAVSLSNSVELLATIFASAFYGFKPVLIPSTLDQTQFQGLLSKIRPDILIAEAASIELKPALSVAPSIKEIIWIVKEGAQHMDWTDKPDGVGQINISTWHDIVRESKASTEIPAAEKDSKTGPVATFTKGNDGKYELIEYTPETLVAGIGAILASLHRDHKVTHKDVLLPTASLTDSYALCWTLGALFANASIALNSVAGDTVDLSAAAAGASPTIIVSSSGAISKYYESIAEDSPGIPQAISNYFQKNNLQKGYMSAGKPSGVSANLSKLRLVLIAQKVSEKDRVQASVLAALRLALGTRVAYALTAAPVAGAITQTNILDYRRKGKSVNVGPPVSSLELYVVGKEIAIDQDTPQGKIVVRGPGVVGGKAELDCTAKIDLDRTITLV